MPRDLRRPFMPLPRTRRHSKDEPFHFVLLIISVSGLFGPQLRDYVFRLYTVYIGRLVGCTFFSFATKPLKLHSKHAIPSIAYCRRHPRRSRLCIYASEGLGSPRRRYRVLPPGVWPDHLYARSPLMENSNLTWMKTPSIVPSSKTGKPPS